MKDLYWWENKKVHAKNWGDLGVPPKNVPVVDTTDGTDPLWRYGVFVHAENMSGWRHVPFEDFPAEFRVQLLLLGVS